MPAVVNNNYRIYEGPSAIDFGNAFDLTRYGIDYGVCCNLRALDFHPFVVIVREISPCLVVLDATGDAERCFVTDPSPTGNEITALPWRLCRSGSACWFGCASWFGCRG